MSENMSGGMSEKRMCIKPGCTVIAEVGFLYCEAHRKERRVEYRGPAKKAAKKKKK